MSKNMDFYPSKKNMGQCLGKSLNSKHGQNVLYTTKILATMFLKQFQRMRLKKQQK